MYSTFELKELAGVNPAIVFKITYSNNRNSCLTKMFQIEYLRLDCHPLLSQKHCNKYKLVSKTIIKNKIK